MLAVVCKSSAEEGMRLSVAALHGQQGRRFGLRWEMHFVAECSPLERVGVAGIATSARWRVDVDLVQRMIICGGLPHA